MAPRPAVIALMAAAVVMAACGSPAGPAAAPPTQMVVDTDMSWDDIAAITYVLSRHDVSVNGIAVDGDGLTHCDAGVTHARQLVAFLGRPEIPVGCGRTVPLQGGAAFPDGWRQNADAFFGLKLPPVRDVFNVPTAVQVIDQALRESPKSTVLSLGPMTNLAEALTLHPDLRGRISAVYAMAGALDVPGNEIQFGRAEWNVFIDPVAAQTVFNTGVPMTLVPLDASDDVPVTVFFRDALTGARATPAGDLVKNLLADPYYYSGAQYFWDPAAAVVSMQPSLARFTQDRLTIVQEAGADLGRVVRSPLGANVQVAADIDAQGFYRAFLSAVSGDPTVQPAMPASRLDVAFGSSGWTVANSLEPTARAAVIGFTNETDSTAGVVVGRLSPGRTPADVEAAIRSGVTSVPSWFQLVLSITAPKGHPATWGVDLEPGVYVVVGGGPEIPLRLLATIEE